MIGIYHLKLLKYLTKLFIYLKKIVYYLVLFILYYIFNLLKLICNYKYSKSSQKMINIYGNQPIVKIEVGRKKLSNFITIANILSIGDFKKNNKYDNLYHVCLRVTIGETQLLVEKNSIITITKWKKISNIEFENVELNRSITLNELLNCTQQKIGRHFFKFNFVKNNCQDFVINILKCSNLGTKDNYNFIKQDINWKGMIGIKIIKHIINILTLILPYLY